MTEQRYQFHGYVCGRQCFTPSPFGGWVTFDQIFIARPNDCRFAVAISTAGQTILWDMYTCTTPPRAGRPMRAPAPVRVGLSDEIDAFVMHAMMTYDS